MKTLLVPLIVVGLVVTPAQGNIISYLRFEEGSGWFTEDQTGLMNGALIWFSDLSPGGGDSGPEGWSTSVYGPTVPLTGEANNGSIRFGGGPSFVNLSNPNHVNLGISFTIEFFFRAEASVVSAGLMYGFQPVNKLFGSFNISESSNLAFGTQFQNSLYYESASLVVLDQWQHYALVKQPGEYSLYIDGLLQFNGSLSPETDGPYFFFGTDISGDREIGEGFRGWLDEFRISDEALTPDRFLCSIPEPSTVTLIVMGWFSLYGFLRWSRRRP